MMSYSITQFIDVVQFLEYVCVVISMLARRSWLIGENTTGRKNADGLLGNAHDAAHGLVVHAHFVEDEEEVSISPFL